MEKTTDAVVPRTLSGRPVRPIDSWNEWLAHWDNCKTAEEMIGLLHAGFRVSIGPPYYGAHEYDPIDRVILYLEIADGWWNSDLLRNSSDERYQEIQYDFGRDQHGNNQKRSASEMRQIVARKAFDVLCQDFFRVDLHAGRQGFAGDWRRVVASEKLFPVILNFFRATETRSSRQVEVRNLSLYGDVAPLEKLARQFLLGLVSFIWDYKSLVEQYGGTDPSRVKAREEEERLVARLTEAKPWTIEVLSFLGELDLLWRWELDEPSLDKLRELALRAELSTRLVLNSRRAKTIEEASVAGSRAAQFLILYRFDVEERKRLKAVLEAEQQKVAAERRIRELSTSK